MPKEEKPQDKPKVTLASLIKELNKKATNPIIRDLGDSRQDKLVEFISTGIPTLDLICGGGLPKGRIVEMFGFQSVGKSTLALMLLKAIVKDTQKKVAYVDFENSMDPLYNEKLGLLSKDVLLIEPENGEQALSVVEKLCQSGMVGGVVIDSVAQIVPMAVAEKEIDGTANMATTARLLSQTLPRLSNAASRSGTILIFLNQIRQSFNLYGSPNNTSGGLALKFATSMRFEMVGHKAEEHNGKEGIPVTVKIVKNKTGLPGRKTELFLMYGEGFDTVTDTLELAIKVGLVIKTGGWFAYKGIKEQGWDVFVAKICSQKGMIEEIAEEIKKIDISI